MHNHQNIVKYLITQVIAMCVIQICSCHISTVISVRCLPVIASLVHRAALTPVSHITAVHIWTR